MREDSLFKAIKNGAVVGNKRSNRPIVVLAHGQIEQSTLTALLQGVHVRTIEPEYL